MTTRRTSGTIPQGVDESIAYRFDFSAHVNEHGAAVDVDGCTLFNQKTGAFENDKLSGAAALDGNVARSQVVSGLERRTLYLLSVAVEFENGNILSAVLPIMGEV